MTELALHGGGAAKVGSRYEAVDRAFWRRVERAMPDFEVRKRWLAEHGREF